MATLYVGSDQTYKTIQEAINAASATEATTIVISAGTYAEDITLDTRSIEQKGNLKFVAAEGAEVTITGLVTLGYRNQGVGAAMWNADVAFEGIIFDQAAEKTHSFSVQDVKSLTLTNCTIIGDGEYGIDSARGNAAGKSLIQGCTFKNAGMQVLGNFGTGLVIDGCTFDESRVNVQAGNGITIQNSTFEGTLTDAAKGDSFYFIRSNNTPINVKDCEVELDSDLTSDAGTQEKWGLLWTRSTNNVLWNIDGLEVNLTEAAMTQDGMDIIKNGNTTYDCVTVNGLTSSGNKVTDLVAKTGGTVKVFANGSFTTYEDGEVVSTVTFDSSIIYVNSAFTGTFGQKIADGQYFGINAFADVASAVKAATADTTQIKVVTGTSVEFYTFAAPELVAKNEAGLLVDMGNNGVSIDETGGTVTPDTAEADSWILGGILIGEKVEVIADVLCVDPYKVADVDGKLTINGAYLYGGTATVSGEMIVNDLFFCQDGYGSDVTLNVEEGGLFAAKELHTTAGAVTLINGTANVESAIVEGEITIGTTGALNITQSMDAATVINNGTVTVSGTSTLDIDLIKGNDITASDVLKNSDLAFESYDWQTGNVMVDGDLEVQGGSFKNVQFRADEGETITLTGAIQAVGATQFKAVNGEIVVNGTFFSDVSEASSIEIEGDASKLTIAAGADVEITGGFYLNGGTTVINGNLAAGTADVKVGLERTDADVETAYATLGGSYAANVTVKDAYIWNAMALINNAETQVTLDNSRFDGWMSFDMNGGTLTVQNGSYLYHQAAEDWTRSTLAGNLIVTTGSVFNANKTNVTLSGNLTVDETAKITVGSIVNTGTINFTVTGDAATNYFGGLVIDANAASNYGQVNVSVEGKNFEAVVNGNDLYVVDTTIYVNSAWAGKEDGADLGGGKYFGVNAFASLGSITPGLTEGARQVQFTYAGGAEDVTGLEITVKNDVAGSSLIYTLGGQTYAAAGGSDVHEFVAQAGETYIFDFKQGDFSFDFVEITKAEDESVANGTVNADGSISGNVDVDVNEFTGRQNIGFTVATGMEGAMELDIDGLKGAAWVVLYDAEGKTVKEYVVIRDGKVTFKDLAAGSYEVAISPAGVPTEVECDVTYNFTQEAVVVTDDTWNNATLFGVDTTAGTTVTDEFTATDVIDWFKFSAADGVNAINFTGEGDFSVIAYTKNASGKLDQCAAFWVFDEKESGVDYTRYLNVAAGSEVYLRIEGYGKDVDYSVALA